MDRTPVPGAFYRHFKNKLYQVIAVATHSETGEQMVVYQALYGDYRIYVRPLDMFVSPVDREKYPQEQQEYRFERVWPEAGQVQPAPQEEPVREQPETMDGVWLGRFLDASTAQEQLAILKQMEGHVSQRELDCMFLSLDQQPEQDKSLEEQVEDIRRYVLLVRRYDGQRLR